MNADNLPCQAIHYLHHLMGGPADGDLAPSSHCYETIQGTDGNYVRDGEPCVMEKEPRWQVLTCTDDYSEPVWMRVNMRYVRPVTSAAHGNGE